MKSKPSFISMGLGLSFALFVALLLSLSGCATTSSPSSDSSALWNPRVGNYTYQQAAAEYGTPLESHKLAKGGTTAEWLLRRNAINSAMAPNVATQYRAGGIDQPTGANVNSLKNEYLRLFFDDSGKLTKWESLYR